MRFLYSLLTLGLLASVAHAQTAPAAADPSAAVAAPAAPSAAAPPKAADDDPRRDKRPSFIPVPIAFYQQETGFAGGVAILPVWRFGQDTAVRKSNARLIGWISEKKQTTLQLTHNIFTPEEKFFLSGELSYYDLAFKYYGIGNETRKSDEVTIKYPLIVFDEKVLKKVAPNLFVGLRYRLTDLGDVELKDGGESGNAAKVYDPLPLEQRNGTTSSGLGPALLFDNRDNVLATYRGNFVDAHVLFNGSALGSDDQFTRYQLDARHFRPLFGSTNTILAAQFMGQYHSGDVPFRELGGMGATLGGAAYNNAYLMRGIYEARFRDRQFTTVQAEIRQKLFWRIDGAVFGAVGQVGRNLSDYSLDGTKVAAGFGGRFRFNRRDRLNIRLDYGVGSGGNSGIIFAVGEAF
ncbi:Surface antigen [Hymenobacter daecheongensis DSM 21074]|uniref:Surface antigen n=1 Tax=Hymenobacter daecheongensis DSM 21074 TaxID=1121955 RepID=A0A1M6MKX3_9BACT|nr:BamA/TamA family outer membrane protein [Hymenobacter daecheongensis]SHJ84102.1 Surface antigen [Hymenobacter daecheongensis DSM 21074]